jgi:putative transposase
MRGYLVARQLDEVLVNVNGKLCYRRDNGAALKLLKRIMGKYGQPRSVITDGLCSDSGAMKEIGGADRGEVGRRLNNRAENSSSVSTT